MNEQGLIFSRSGLASKLYEVSPLLYPQFGINNKNFLPHERDLPKHGLITRMEVFDFGFADPSQSIAPYDTAYCPLVMGRDFLVEMVTGTYSTQISQVLQNPAAVPAVPGGPGAIDTPGFLVNFLHTHQGVERQWSNKNITDIESVGHLGYPLVLKSPALLPMGDTIMCVIQNLLNATLQAQIVFTGGQFDTEEYGQETGASGT